MTELYPPDADLNALSGTTDAQQGVAYPAIYESPYYTTFYKMLYRLLDVARRAGDLRVYKDGDLTFGVRAGAFMDGDALRTFVGAAGQALADNATNSVYLTPDGALAVSAGGFPAPSATPHIRLAEVVTADGGYDFDDITDRRGTAFLAPASGVPATGLAGRVAHLASAFVDDADGTGTLTLQVKDAAGNDLAANVLVEVWIGASNDFGEDAISSFAVTTGTLRETMTANAAHRVISDGNGAIVMDIDNGGPGALYAWASLGGRIFASGEIVITA
jgi:hypothetical protein